MNSTKNFLRRKLQRGVSSLVLLGLAFLGGCKDEPSSLSSLLDQIDIPYQKFVLKNGLTLIVHEDHKTPIVAVNVWYHVGSKNEVAGKTGFAHLFEHLMFNGSEHYNKDYFRATEKIGATQINGTTSNDRTNYFQNVPKNALDSVLWLESDRMGYLLSAISQAKLDEQRGVVKNEKRQGENRPYGKAWELIARGTAPHGHPYSWTVIGSMKDIEGASLEDVRGWFKTYYGAANAVITVVGDVKAEEVLVKVKKYFEEIPSGPPVRKMKKWIGVMKGDRRETLEDRVPAGRIYKVWNVPPYGEVDNIHLSLFADILGGGRTSRLYQRLILKEEIATEVSAFVMDGELRGQFFIIATASAGVKMQRLEDAIDDELEALIESGPSKEELETLKVRYFSGFIRGMERVGGWGGKSDILIRNEVFLSDPSFYKKILGDVLKAKSKDLQKAASDYLSSGNYVLEVVPFPDYEVSKEKADRSELPIAPIEDMPRFPELEKATLSCGVKLILVRRPALPLLSFYFQLPMGYSCDSLSQPGTAKMTLDMLDQATKTRSGLEIRQVLYGLGGELEVSLGAEFSEVNLSILKVNVDQGLDIFSEVILEPAFLERNFQTIKKQQIAGIKKEKKQPMGIVSRLIPTLTFGKKHPYGTPRNGTEASLEKIKREDLIDFHKAWFKPNHTTLVVVGDTTMEEILPKLESRLQSWQAGELPRKNFFNVKTPLQEKIYFVDRPDSSQSAIASITVLAPIKEEASYAADSFLAIFGGDFTSRLNMNLREDKHWTYGARSQLGLRLLQAPMISLTSVQADKTFEALREIKKEMSEILEVRPISVAELDKVKKNKTLSLSGSWETHDGVARFILNAIRRGFSEKYLSSYPKKISALQVEDLKASAKRMLFPERQVWIIVGDRKKLEPQAKKLGLKIEWISADF